MTLTEPQTWGALLKLAGKRESNEKRETPIYYDAFAMLISSVYGNTGYNINVTDMAYNMALNSFIRGGYEGENQRRKLMYFYMASNGFSRDEANDYINRCYNAISASNIEISRILRNLCTIYDYDVTRKYSIGDNEINETKTDYLNNIFNSAKLNYRLNQIHQIAKLTGKAMIRPRIRRKRLDFKILHSDTYLTTKDDYGTLTDVLIPFRTIIPGSEQSAQRFEHWNKNLLEILDEKGNPTQFIQQIGSYNTNSGKYIYKDIMFYKYEHGYNALPFIELNYDINDGDGSEANIDLWELCKRQLKWNMIDTMENENAVFSAFAMIYLTNFKTKEGGNVKLSPSKMFNFSVPEGEIEPDANMIEPTTHYDSFESWKRDLIKTDMKNMGLPTSLVTDNPGLAASGAALKQDRIELDEHRRIDVVLMKEYEQELIRQTLNIINKDIASPYKGKINYDLNNLNINIEYGKFNYYESNQEKVERLNYEKQKGVISPSKYYKEITGSNKEITDEDAIKIMKENIELFKQIGDTENENGRKETDNQSGDSGSAKPE